MSNSECKLQMLDLYFSKFDFTQERKSSNESAEYITSLTINYAVNKSDDTRIKIIIDTNVKNKTESISVNLQTVGIFKIDKGDMEEAVYEQLMKANTVAIMLPYIRSQISLITTQPGIIPVMMPPINVSSLVEMKTPDAETQTQDTLEN